ncbi:MAG TPA: response regulator transcription factor [Ignavibacteriaceae bacterium]|nr:response regulator transcription factor [Ignavibacteriaceae bacterium]
MEILIAEDDEQIANSLRKNFAEDGNPVMIAKDGEEAIHFLKSISFDVILLDWRMPKVSGIEVCRYIRESGNKVPIILLTALSQVKNKVEALNLGADDYVTKPFSFDELSARINAVVRRYLSNTNELIFNDITLDLIGRKVKTPRGEIYLSGKEFDLIKYFILHKGSIMSKEDICKEVWGVNFVPSTNIVEATVKNLRRKIEDNYGKNLIKSIYGEGYLFIVE